MVISIQLSTRLPQDWTTRAMVSRLLGCYTNVRRMAATRIARVPRGSMEVSSQSVRC
jgi:hypothetical protein